MGGQCLRPDGTGMWKKEESEADGCELGARNLWGRWEGGEEEEEDEEDGSFCILVV